MLFEKEKERERKKKRDISPNFPVSTIFYRVWKEESGEKNQRVCVCMRERGRETNRDRDVEGGPVDV